MKIDLTLQITPKMAADAQGNEKKALVGHLGTHFDVMDKTFPLEDTERPGLVFDVPGIRDRDIGLPDIDLRQVEPGMFVAFHTASWQRWATAPRPTSTSTPSSPRSSLTPSSRQTFPSWASTPPAFAGAGTTAPRTSAARTGASSSSRTSAI